MGKQKKPLTIKQKRNKCRAIQYSTFAGQYAAIVTPYAALTAINWDRWFMSNAEGWKIGLGGSIAIVLVSVAVFLVSKNKENDAKTSGYIALILGWLLVGFIFKLMAQIMLEIADIMFITSTGLIGAFGLDQASKAAKKKADRHQKSLIDANEELDKEQAREEIEKEREKKVKVVIKK